MTNTQNLQANGFTRVERDDRLLDVFSKETPEKGVELWEKWNQDVVEIIRIHNGKQSNYQLARPVIEEALLANTPIKLK